MTRIKQVLVTLYLIPFAFGLPYAIIAVLHESGPAWYIFLATLLPALVVLSVVFYASGTQPERFRWFWRLIPSGFVAFLVWDMLYPGYIFSEESLAIGWVYLSPAVYMSFRFAFPSSPSTAKKKGVTLSRKMGDGRSDTGNILIFLVLVVVVSIIFMPPQRPRPPDSAHADLRNAATAQEAFFAEHSIYSDSVERLMGQTYGLFLSSGVTLQILSADQRHYSMMAFREDRDRMYLVNGPGGSVLSLPKKKNAAIPPLMDSLVKVLRGRDDRMRAQVVQFLVGNKDPRVTKLMIDLAEKDSNPLVRGYAVRALALMEDKGALFALLHASGDSDIGVQKEICNAIDGPVFHFDAMAVSEVLTAAAKSGKLKVRGFIALALGQMKDEIPSALRTEILRDEEPKIREDGRKVEFLVVALKDGSSEVRKRAARDLSTTKDPRAVESMLVALKAPESEVRGYGTSMFSKVRDERAVIPLVDALNDEAVPVRLGATRALAYQNDSRALNPLAASLKDKDLRVRQSAANAISSLAHSRALRSDDPARERLVAALTDALKDQDKKIQRSAAEALGKLKAGGTETEDVLIAALENPSSPQRANIAFRLGELGSKRAFEPLTKVLRDRDDFLVGHALGALAKIDSRRAVDYLIPALHHEKPSVRRIAALELRGVPDPRAVEPLLQVLRTDTDEGARRYAAEALGRTKDERATELLIEVSRNDASTVVRTAALTALGEMGRQRAMASLTESLKDDSVATRRDTVNALGKSNNKNAVEPLIGALQDKDSGVRRSAARGLGQLKDSRALRPLAALLTDEDVGVRSSAASSIDLLVVWSSPRPSAQDIVAITEPLAAALNDPDKQVRINVAMVLGRLKDERSVPELISALEDANPNHRPNAAFHLGEIKDKRAFEPLTNVLGDRNDFLVGHALGALAKIDPEAAFAHLIKALGHKSESVRANAVIILGKSGDKRAVEPLKALLANDPSPEIKNHTARALQNLS